MRRRQFITLLGGAAVKRRAFHHAVPGQEQTRRPHRLYVITLPALTFAGSSDPEER